MTTSIFLFLCATVFAYEDISEKEHFEIILRQPDELKKQLYCYLDKGPCSDLAIHHKMHMIQSILEGCAQCSPTHKHNVHIFINAAKSTYPDLYKELRAKYDPDNKYYDHLIEVVDRY